MAPGAPYDFYVVRRKVIAPISDVVPASRFVCEVIEFYCRGTEKSEGVVHLISSKKTGCLVPSVLFAHNIGNLTTKFVRVERYNPLQICGSKYNMLQTPWFGV